MFLMLMWIDYEWHALFAYSERTIKFLTSVIYPRCRLPLSMDFLTIMFCYSKTCNIQNGYDK